jgi:hypothetical protein
MKLFFKVQNNVGRFLVRFRFKSEYVLRIGLSGSKWIYTWSKITMDGFTWT